MHRRPPKALFTRSTQGLRCARPLQRLSAFALALLVAIACPFARPASIQAETSPSSSQGRAIVCISASDATDSGLSVQSDDGSTWEHLMDVSMADATEQDGSDEEDLSAQATGGVGKELVLVTSDTLSTDELVASLQARDDVLFAEPDEVVSVTSDDATSGADALRSAASPSPASYERFQWGLENDGSVAGGTAGYDIGDTQGLSGSSDVVIAVVDSGVDYTLPSLSSRMIDLSDSRYGTLMADTGCGRHGFNSNRMDETVYDPTDVMDTFGHGTHMAGIIGADGTTGATAGVMDDVTILPVRAVGSTGSGYDSDCIRALAWMAVANEDYGVGIRAANYSINSDIGTKSMTLAFEAVQDAGITMVASSGNNGMNIDAFENSASVSRTGTQIVVDAMDAKGASTSFTNYGWTTDIFAPGDTILSTTCSSKARFDAFEAMADGAAVAYEGFEDAGTADAAEPSTDARLTFHYLDATKADDLGDRVATSSDHPFLGSRSLEVSVPADGSVTLISEPISLTDIGDLSDTYVNLVAWTSPSYESSVTIDLRTTDGFTSDFLSIEDANDSWTSIDGTMDHPLSNIASKLGKTLDTDRFQIKMAIKASSASTVAIDSVGVGHGLRTYELMSGTSMATPMVTGVVGLMSARYPDECSAKVSARVVGGAVDKDSYADLCSTGGRVNVDKSASDPDPVIQESSFSGRMLTLEGWFLGEDQGGVTVDGQDATVLSWQADVGNDRGKVTVRVPDGVEGSQTIVITRASDGAYGRRKADVGETLTDFDDLSVPTGHDYLGSEKALMSEIDGSIYLLTSGVSEDPANLTGIVSLWRYDIESGGWEWLSSPPAEMTETSTLTSMESLDGRLYLLSEQDGTDDKGNTVHAGQLVSYDPAKDEWTRLDEMGDLPGKGTLCAFKGELLEIGGSYSETTSDEICVIDTTTGERSEPIAHLDVAVTTPHKAVACGDAIAILNGDPSKAIVITDLTSTSYVALPAHDSPQSYDFALARSEDGVVLAGLVYTGDGGYTDTWTLDLDTGTWSALGKRMSTTYGHDLAGVTVNGSLYVWARGVQTESGTFFRRAHLFDVPDPTAPDAPSTPDVEPVSDERTASAGSPTPQTGEADGLVGIVAVTIGVLLLATGIYSRWVTPIKQNARPIQAEHSG
ncbi:MAG: S8 family serine peptidase [Atopobiaceae bacterium]|nr:S8 family serine peptidase [Atopobiaceae bacterium]MCI2173325.1 S8 family serine peptidase [Atopobiaceae bacterium]MCI2207320.1 S8 family serine peptidase [Atopobiaceae bacterium]